MNLIKRSIEDKFKEYLKLFPVVAVIGPRQCGKTTFSKMVLPEWKYIDLEKPSDYTRINSDIEFFLDQYGENCIIDEAQELPSLFPVLRSFIDKNREKKGQIVLLGSINPLLIEHISESLAGRVGFIEMQTLSVMETKTIDLENQWLTGGYPETITWTDNRRTIWMEQYVKTFIERDLHKYLESSLSSHQQNQLLQMIAHNHANVWNASQTASAFGVSYHTINHYVEMLEKFFLIRKLRPYFANIGKRLIKSPKVYFFDTGLLHYLLNINTQEDLRVSNYRGYSFEGFVIDQIIKVNNCKIQREKEYFYYRTSQGDEIDLLIKNGDELEAVEIKTSTAVDARDLNGFIRCLDQLDIEKGTVLYFGKENYRLNSRIELKTVPRYLNLV